MKSLDFDRAAPVYYVACCPSTNGQLKELAGQGATKGTVLIAGSQSEGRGRMGRSFTSPEGGVYLSMLLKPSLNERAPQLSTLAALAVRKALLDCCDTGADIKWPNDLLLDGKKICGILAESVIFGQELSVILGVGVNLNTEAEAFPPELCEIAGSLYSLRGKKYDLQEFAHRLVDELDSMYSRWEKGESFAEEYRAACINLGRQVTLLRGDEQIYAKAVDIADDMSLVVIMPDGREEKIRFGEVSLR